MDNQGRTGSRWKERFHRIVSPTRPEEMSDEERFDYEQLLFRIGYFVRIKAVVNALIVLLYLLVLPQEYRLGPVLVAAVDGLLLIPYLLVVRRWPSLATYGVLTLTAVAISTADIVSGHQTGTSGVLYAILIVAGAVVLVHTRGIAVVTGIITAIYVASFALEFWGVIPIELHLTPGGLARVLGLHVLAFGGMAAISEALIHLYRQLLKTRGQRSLLAALLDGFREISGDLDLHSLLQRIAERAVSTIPSAVRAVLLVQEDGSMVVRGAAGSGSLPPLGQSFPVALLVPALEDSPGDAFSPQPAIPRLPEETQACLFSVGMEEGAILFPLRMKQTGRGLLAVTTVGRSDAFGVDTRRYLDLFAHQAAVAVENAHLLAESESRLQEALALHRIGREIAGLLQMHELVPAIYRHIQDAMEVSTFLLAIQEPTTGEMALISSVHSGQVLPDQRISSEGFLGWVVRNGCAICCGDIEVELTKYAEIQRHGAGGAGSGPRSLLAVPLSLGSRVIGALSVQSPKAHAYGERDEQLLASLANYVAVAVQNARLYEELQQQTGELQRKQAEQQRLIATVSQRLQGPVEAVAGFARLLKDSDAGRSEEEGEYLDRIERNSYWTAQLVRDMIFLSRLDRAGDEMEPIALTTLVQGVGTNLGLEQAGIVLEVQQDMPVLHADPVLMWALFRNLLQNAQGLLGGTASPRIEVGCQARADFYRIYVQGNGAALPPQSMERVSELFFPAGDPCSGIPGIGLAVAQQVSQKYGAEIGVESQGGGGTIFTVLLPTTLGRQHVEGGYA